MTTLPPPSHDRSDRGLWRHADFLRLWAAQAVSAFGSRITRTALPIIAVDTLGQPDIMIGVLAAMQLVPGVFLAMVAGGFVDRGRKRRILIASDLIRAGLVGSLTLSWALGLLSRDHGALSMIQVIVAGAGVGAATALFQITDVAYLPALIGRRRLADGNAKLETTEAVAEITGPASAGVLIAALGAPLAVALDAASYVWSAFMLGRIRTRDARAAVAVPVPAGAGDDTAASDDAVAEPPRPSTGEDFRIGMRVVFGHPQVRPIVLTLMMWSVAGGFFLALYTPFCLRELGLPKEVFGMIIAMGGIGSLAGAMLARTFAKALGVGRTLIVTAALSLLFTLFVPAAGLVSSRTAQVACLVAHQLFGDGFAVAFVILAVTLRQTVLPKQVLGRANAAVHVCTGGVLPVVAILAGGLAALVGIRLAIWVGFLIGLSAPAFLWSLRHLRTMPIADLGASDSQLVRMPPGASDSQVGRSDR